VERAEALRVIHRHRPQPRFLHRELSPVAAAAMGPDQLGPQGRRPWIELDGSPEQDGRPLQAAVSGQGARDPVKFVRFGQSRRQLDSLEGAKELLRFALTGSTLSLPVRPFNPTVNPSLNPRFGETP